MNCPKCNIEMTEGELRLHTGFEFRLMFSPHGSPLPVFIKAPPFIEPLDGQNEIKFTSVPKDGWDLHPYYIKDNTYRCAPCGITVVKS